MATSIIHTGGRQFKLKIRRGKTCTPPQTNTQRGLQSHNRVGRHKVHQNYTRLGLKKKKSASITTRIYQQSPKTVQPKTKEKQNQTYPSVPIIYGAKKQYATQPSSAPLLEKKGKKFIQ